MSLLRSAFLKASESDWLRRRATRVGFVQRTAARFLPGENLDAALAASQRLAEKGISTLLTHLGENINDREEAADVTREYINVIDRIRAAGLPSEISVKLTQLGLDVDPAICFENLSNLIEHAEGRTVWIDMEHSPYVDVTLDIYRRAHARTKNVGVCVQAYLYRTEEDVESLISIGASVRLVKGAYNEPPEISYPKKSDVDESFFRLAQRLLSAEARSNGVRAAIATHDRGLIARIIDWGVGKAGQGGQGIAKSEIEFAMLYGIQRTEQTRLASEGFRMCVLVSYGAFWFPWFMRRLAERPANALFLARNIFS
jgi:proline dehydrogenase